MGQIRSGNFSLSQFMKGYFMLGQVRFVHVMTNYDM
jgi:hypothetical protein